MKNIPRSTTSIAAGLGLIALVAWMTEPDPEQHPAAVVPAPSPAISAAPRQVAPTEPFAAPSSVSMDGAGAGSAALVRSSARPSVLSPPSTRNPQLPALPTFRSHAEWRARLVVPLQPAGPNTSARPALLPAIFLDPAELNLDAQQLAQLELLRADFVRRIEAQTGGTPPAPTDPAYRRLWRNLLSQADQEFYGLFGHEAFNAMSIRRRREGG